MHFIASLMKICYKSDQHRREAPNQCPGNNNEDRTVVWMFKFSWGRGGAKQSGRAALMKGLYQGATDLNKRSTSTTSSDQLPRYLYLFFKARPLPLLY
jgi:hypothetical protein